MHRKVFLIWFENENKMQNSEVCSKHQINFKLQCGIAYNAHHGLKA